MNNAIRPALLAALSLLIAAVRCAPDIDVSPPEREPINPLAVKEDADGRKRITIEVSATKRYDGTVDFEGQPIPGSRAAGGTLEGKEGSFTSVDYEGRRYVNVYLPGKLIEIVHDLKGGRPTIRETDTSDGNLECGTGRSFPRPMTSALTGCGDTECDAARSAMESDVSRTGVCRADPPAKRPILIKALIAFTDDAEAAASANIYPMLLSAYTLTNVAFSNSKLNIEFGIASEGRTPCIVRAPYSESTTWHWMVNDLKRLFDPLDFELAHLHTWRDRCNADVVLLITENKKSHVSGKACVMQRLSPNFAPYAFAVIRRDSIAANYAFTHELGHLMGAGHVNVAGACRTAMCPYSAAWTFNIGPRHFETVMGDDTNRRNILHFSAPNIPYGSTGAPTGNPAADNARTLRISAKTVSEFRTP